MKLKEHESSADDTPQDPFQYMFSGIPDGDHLYEQILLDDDDYEVNAQRAHGPLDERGLVERAATSPPYIIPLTFIVIILQLMKIFQQMQSWKNMVQIGICIMFRS